MFIADKAATGRFPVSQAGISYWRLSTKVDSDTILPQIVKMVATGRGQEWGVLFY